MLQSCILLLFLLSVPLETPTSSALKSPINYNMTLCLLSTLSPCMKAACRTHTTQLTGYNVLNTGKQNLF